MLSAVQFNKNYKGMSANVVRSSTVRGLGGICWECEQTGGFSPSIHSSCPWNRFSHLKSELKVVSRVSFLKFDIILELLYINIKRIVCEESVDRTVAALNFWLFFI